MDSNTTIVERGDWTYRRLSCGLWKARYRGEPVGYGGHKSLKEAIDYWEKGKR